jgi:hypothetical protein
MSGSATAKWVLLALLGLAIAIGVAIAAANLASRQIGIASESVSAGNALAPALNSPGGEGQRSERKDRPEPGTTTTVPSQPPATAPEEPSEPPAGPGEDDHGGDSDGDDD